MESSIRSSTRQSQRWFLAWLTWFNSCSLSNRNWGGVTFCLCVLLPFQLTRMKYQPWNSAPTDQSWCQVQLSFLLYLFSSKAFQQVAHSSSSCCSFLIYLDLSGSGCTWSINRHQLTNRVVLNAIQIWKSHYQLMPSFRLPFSFSIYHSRPWRSSSSLSSRYWSTSDVGQDIG